MPKPKKKSEFYEIEGRQMVSVTTALKIIETGIGDWKSRVGASEAARVSKVESGYGTKVHALIEADIKGTVAKMPKIVPVSVTNAFSAYQQWRLECMPTIIESEKLVYSTLHGYAGTCDAIGQTAVYDFKTSKKIHPIYWLQLAAYAGAIMEMEPGRHITRLVVVRLDKDLSIYSVEEREYSSDLLLSFLSCLRMWRFFNITEKEDDNDERTRASLDIEPNRLRNEEERADEEVDRPEVPHVRSGEVW